MASVVMLNVNEELNARALGGGVYMYEYIYVRMDGILEGISNDVT